MSRRTEGIQASFSNTQQHCLKMRNSAQDLDMLLQASWYTTTTKYAGDFPLLLKEPKIIKLLSGTGIDRIHQTA